MNRLYNVNDWVEMNEGQKMAFPGENRKVVLQVNSPEPVLLYLIQEVNGDGTIPPKKEPRFLARVCGRDTLEFYVPGTFSLSSDGLVQLTGTELGEPVYAVDDDPDVYTRIVERRQRNHEQERMMWMAQQNFERVLRTALDDQERRYELRERAVTRKAEDEAKAARDAAAAARKAESKPDAGAVDGKSAKGGAKAPAGDDGAK